MASSRFESMIRRINWYPPFLGMGIKVVDWSPEFTRFDVELREKWYTRNLFGTHFGGSLYTMTDPFYVFIVTLNLGRDYIVWDKSAEIEFLKPAKGTVRAVFEIPSETLDRMRAEVNEIGKQDYVFETDLRDPEDVVVARVRKTVYVRRKRR